jgi:hypothetical protein
MLGANESAKCKHKELGTRQGNQGVASSEYHIERGFGPVNDSNIKIFSWQRYGMDSLTLNVCWEALQVKLYTLHIAF